MTTYATAHACPLCEGKIRSVNGIRGKFLACERFPRCTWQAGGDALTVTRMRTHAIFDQLWKQHIMIRTNAYRLLRRELKLNEEQAHIGRLSISQCHQLVARLRGIVEVEL